MLSLYACWNLGIILTRKVFWSELWNYKVWWETTDLDRWIIVCAIFFLDGMSMNVIIERLTYLKNWYLSVFDNVLVWNTLIIYGRVNL